MSWEGSVMIQAFTHSQASSSYTADVARAVTTKSRRDSIVNLCFRIAFNRAHYYCID